MVNGVKEFSDVAFQDERRVSVVSRDLFCKDLKALYSRVRAFGFARSVGVVDKGLVKDLVQLLVHRLIQNSVTDTRNVNEAGFGVGDAARDIWVVCPNTLHKPFVERKEIFLQTQLKRRDFATVSFPPSELPPRAQKIFRTNYVIKKSTMSPPPRQDTLGYSEDSAVA